MYTSGHTKILMQAIKLYYAIVVKEHVIDLNDEEQVRNLLKTIPMEQAKAHFKRLLKGLRLPFVTWKLLRYGLKYPDFPCGKYELSADGRLNFKQRLCSLFRLVNDLSIFPDIFSVSYSSHNGYFSLWHAMTFDPRKSNSTVANEVIRQVLMFCMLAVKDNTLKEGAQPNAFWLGMALHTIMDSYSPAHVARDGAPDHIPSTSAQNIQLKDYQHINLFQELKSSLKDVSKSLEVSDRRDVDAIVSKLCSKYNVKGAHKQKKLRRLADFFYFQNFQEHTLTSYLSRGRGKRTANLYKLFFNNNDRYQGIKVRSFYFYLSQDAMFHKKNDMIRSVKLNKLYYPAILDTYIFIKEFINVIKQNPLPIGITSYLQSVKGHLERYTLCLSSDRVQNKNL